MCVCVPTSLFLAIALGEGRACALALSSAVEMLGLDVPLTMTRVLTPYAKPTRQAARGLPPGHVFFFSSFFPGQCLGAARPLT